MARTGTPFGGLAGEMLSRTISIGAIFTGLIFLAVVGTLGTVAPRIGSDLVVLAAAQFLVSFFLAHFTVEGYSDQWERAGRPIPPTEVGTVALRYMALAIILLAPLLVAVRSRDAALAMLIAPTGSAIALLVYLLAVAASPPALLVVAVSASSWSDLVSPAHWGSRFRGRWIDFFLIYVIFVGALFCLVLVGLPIVAFAWTKSTETLEATSAGVALFATGFTISLLGRLCGSFAIPPAPEATETRPASLHPSLSQFKGVVAARSEVAGGSMPPTAVAASRKAALLDAGARVEQLRATHGADSTALAAALRELDGTFLPHPSVRQALAVALVAAGRQQEALDVAREAIPSCMKTGSVAAAALIYEALLPSGETFGLAKEQIVALGDALKSMKRYTAAVKVYAGVLSSNAGDVKAMKGMIAVAQTLSQQQETAATAARIYGHLISHCPGSPLLDFVNAERAKLDRKAV